MGLVIFEEIRYTYRNVRCIRTETMYQYSIKMCFYILQRNSYPDDAGLSLRMQHCPDLYATAMFQVSSDESLCVYTTNITSYVTLVQNKKERGLLSDTNCCCTNASPRVVRLRARVRYLERVV